MKSTITMATLAMSAVLASTAVAAPRTTELTLDRYDRPVIVERERDDLKKAAVFSADPQAIDENAIVLIEIHSISGDSKELRFRCIAQTDVAECLGKRVSIPYRKTDEKVVLSLTAKPKSSPAAIALLAGEKTVARN